MPQAQPQIPFAHSGPLSDRVLHGLKDVVHRATNGQDMSSAEAEFLLVSVGPIIEELLERRKIQVAIVQHLEENVVYLEDHIGGA
ncbi:hypothetical protein [Pacificibacter marinus]|uniref:hypothetical protein n=1 Tax=Pacificibacter marinus TaxID=658057 RepID=UPI001C077A45|nr:hypothetical protein [Pacificibacter marinus]MBU2867039.1 hypothetical protein [Pacificibacter marinus]